MDSEILFSAVAAIRNHFLIQPEERRDLHSIHEMWNRWPNPSIPVQVTCAAIAILEADGVIVRDRSSSQDFFRLAP
ncbi:hypothetical protein [Noviherbaspirillum saxi]|uniref:hypothetical protein n=1 Tax=Noviherbaspirillum saxi TaxID=2320863 RepID=UPI0011C42B79|nr:hypothetical protein [Noviherbaspirillum saxi]